MTRNDADETDSFASRPPFRRRDVLRAVGAGAVATAATGVAAGRRSPDDRSPSGGEGDVDSTFGFAAVDGSTTPPVAADHVVEIRIRPREGAQIPEFFFEPTGLAIDAGDTVRFDFVTGHHTVTAFHPGFGQLSRVPEGVPPFSSPVLPAGGYWLYTFETPGVYDLHCGPHEVFGHVIRLVVGGCTTDFEPLPDPCAGGETEGDATETDDEGPAESLRPPQLTAYTVLRDPALDPETVVETGSVSWDDLDDESKRLFVEVSGFPPC